MLSEPRPLDRKILDVSQGVARTFSRTIYDENGYKITGFTGNEILSVDISTGEGGAITDATATATWIQPTEGSYQINVPALDLSRGIYSIRALLDPNGESCYPSPREIYKGFLRVNPSPNNSLCGSLRLYCDYADLLEKAPYLESTHTDNDLSGFTRQRYRARVWVDSCITRASTNSTFYGRNAIFYGVIAPYNYGIHRVEQMLKEDKLMLTPAIRDAATHYALFLITDSLSSTPTTGSYQEIAQKHFSRANSIMQSAIAAFDENGSGEKTYTVDLRVADGRVSI